MRFPGILSILLLLSTAAFAQEDYSFDYYSVNTDTPYEIGITSKTPMTIDELYKSINGLKAPSIETLLPVLKQKDPSLFSEYVLMYGSRSLQTSTFQAPRALLVSKHAEMVIAFNGDKTEKNFNALEVMYFDGKTNKFNFQEITFRGGKVTYSDVNAQKCLSCHQSPYRSGVDPRPNWEAYNVWPGAYGSVGHISQVTDPTYVPTGVSGPDGTTEPGDAPGSHYVPFLADQLSQEEVQAYQFFTNVQPTHPRYMYLEPFTNFGTVQYPAYFDIGGLGIPNTEPTRLTQSLAVLNARRLGRMIQTEYPEIYNRYKYAILAAAKCFVLPLPPTVSAWHKARLTEQNLPEKIVGDYKVLTKLEQGIDFIFKAYGIETADWTMDFNTSGAFAFGDKYGIPGGFNNNNVAIAGGLQEVWQVPQYGDAKSCDGLIKKSLEVLSEPIAAHYDEITASNQPLLNRCISCHETLEVGPYIPFDKPAALQEALVKNDSALYKKIKYRLGVFPNFGDAMPPQGYVKAGQKEEVLSYIEKLYSEKTGL